MGRGSGVNDWAVGTEQYQASHTHVDWCYHRIEDGGVQTKRSMIDGIWTCQLIAKAIGDDFPTA
jgi:hypothetical protein